MSPESLNITLTYAGQLASEAGVTEETNTVAGGTPLVDLLRTAAESHGGKFQNLLFTEDDELRRALVISINDTQVTDPASLTLTDDCEVFLMTPIAGG